MTSPLKAQQGAPAAARRARLREALVDLGLLAASAAALAWVLGLVFAADVSPGSTSSSYGSHGPAAAGTIRQCAGGVRRRAAGSLVWHAVRAGEPLFAGDTVFSSRHGSAVIDLLYRPADAAQSGGSAEITLQPRTLVVVEAHRASGGPSMRLLRGEADARTSRGIVIHAGQDAIELTGGSSAVLTIDRRQRGSVFVAQGQASVLRPSGRSTQVAGGQQLEMVDGRLGKTSVDAGLRPLLPPQRTVLLEGRPLRFSWRRGSAPGESGISSRVLFELSSDRSFSRVIERRHLQADHLELTAPAEGRYYWRLSGGKSVVVRQLDLHIRRPPQVIEPLANSIVDLSTALGLNLSWSGSEGPYRVEVAGPDDSTFAAPLLAVSSPEPRFFIPRQHASLGQEGRRCVRVQAATLWSAPVCFALVLRPVLRAPTLFAPESDELRDAEQGSFRWYTLVGGIAHAAAPTRRILLRWEKLGGAVHYDLEVATDREFAHSVFRQRTASTYLRFSPPALQVYYWRVRAVDSEGRLGEASAIHTIVLSNPKPSALGPADGSVRRWQAGAPRVTLEWRSPTPADRWLVETSRTVHFTGVVGSHPVAQQDTDSGIQRLDFIAEGVGVVFWRVFAVSAAGGRGLPSAVRRFSIVATAPEPVLSGQSTTESGSGPAGASAAVRLEWTPAPGGSYEVQVALDPEFPAQPEFIAESGLETHRLRETVVDLSLAGLGTWYWRVRGLRPDTRWSPTATVEILPAPPSPLFPLADAVLPAPGARTTVSVHFSWTAADPRRGYVLSVKPEAERSHWPATHFEVEPSAADPSHPRSEQESDTDTNTALDSRLEPEITASALTPISVTVALQPGSYAWSVRAVVDDVRSAASDPRALRVSAQPTESTAEIRQAPASPAPLPSTTAPTTVAAAAGSSRAFMIAPSVGVRRTGNDTMTPTLGLAGGLRLVSKLWLVGEFLYVMPNDVQSAIASAGVAALWRLPLLGGRFAMGLQAGASGSYLPNDRPSLLPGIHLAGSLEAAVGSGHCFGQASYRFVGRAVGGGASNGSVAASFGYRLSWSLFANSTPRPASP